MTDSRWRPSVCERTRLVHSGDRTPGAAEEGQPISSPGATRFGSDVTVDLLKGLEIPYVALNSGASFRGLHDSLVNRPGAPEMILCPHNDWDHQIRLARQRGTYVGKAHIGVAIEEPPPDFAGLARVFSWHAEGPIDDPDAVGAAVRRAAQIVIEEGHPAPIDVVCRHR